MIKPIPPAPMCPKTTKCTITYRLCVKSLKSSPSITLEESCISHDVPFGNNFLVQNRLELKGDASTVSVVRSCRVDFLKSCGFLKSTIEKNTISGVSKSSADMVSILESWTPVDGDGDG